ncbi:oxyanion-translocating ATPase [Synechococcus sp. PCC 7502]|uniref:Get3/ArsA fold putative tail anchor-mediating ATPase NosAFP n=1 Tax=Synechococcus sp. PCC 7502 TaxID=1173263 RepID=UPI00029FEFC6|nr:ArsA family ATPase [Synechococcus sp. PCC 7502]AFY73743.1 oxyanion-translocating ATPase [Synechococcus sp. PCC 7502]
MSQILTFLGKGGVGKTTVAIAVAKAYANQGKRVLLVGQQTGYNLMLGHDLSTDPREISPNLLAVNLSATVLLERYWEKMKNLESQYLRIPFLKEVYGQELGILPGMDQALGLSFVREQDAENKYDYIIYDGSGDLNTLRMLGMPEILAWYLRRFKQVLVGSAVGQAMSPFIEPMLKSILQVSATEDLTNQAGKVPNVLEQGQQAVNNPNRVAAYLVTTNSEIAIAVAKYLWSSSQQIGLSVAGVLSHEVIADSEFGNLPVQVIPDHVETLEISDRLSPHLATISLTVDISKSQVKLFLPTFDKKQVKLIQSGPEVTIEAGDQRRNLFLPPELTGRQASGAKFQDGYLIITFA